MLDLAVNHFRYGAVMWILTMSLGHTENDHRTTGNHNNKVDGAIHVCSRKINKRYVLPGMDSVLVFGVFAN